MQFHPEDPRLTAYLLGELPADEATVIEHAVAADPALGIAFQELEHVRNLLSNTLAPGKATLHAEQRETILRAARHQDGSGKIIPLSSQRRSLKSLLIPLSAAAIVTLAIFLVLKLPGGPPSAVALPEDMEESSAIVPMEVALFPAPGPPDAGISMASHSAPRPTASSDLAKISAAHAKGLRSDGDLFLRKIADRLAESSMPDVALLPPLRPRATLNPAEHPSLALPIHVGRASLPWVTRSIRVEKKLPPVDAVRLEEIVNHFQFRPIGPAAVSQGVTLSTETLACPWKPSSVLLIASFRGHNDIAREVSASFRANADSVQRFRLLGFSPVTGLTPEPLPSRLPAKAITTLVIEIEPSGTNTDLGTIEWFASGQSAAPIAITRPLDAEPSDDARFATLVCTFAQWLVRDPSGPIDTALLSAFARECAAEGLPADRVDFLNLIDQSIHL